MWMGGHRKSLALIMVAVIYGSSTLQAAEESEAARGGVDAFVQTANPDPYADETPAERDARMKWWREAKFGMFIHWGVYAVPAGVYKGRRIRRYGEWIFSTARIPFDEYREFARQFNPVKYDADEWVRLASAAGMKYMIITSKHCDGFALFDTKVNDWSAVKATPYGKDLLHPLAEACRKYDMKLGFYYTQALDWSNGGAVFRRVGKWDPVQDQRTFDEYINEIAVPQVRELLTNYGEFPNVLWWDAPMFMDTREHADKLIALLKLKPGIIHNNRLGAGYKGDTETPEQHIPAKGYPGRDWETCMTMNRTWGYKSYDNRWKSTRTLIHHLVDVVSKGGNFLLNVGPTAEGLIPQPSVDRLKEIGAWMKVNGKAIYGTAPGIFEELPFNGRCTRKEETLYLHVFDWPADLKLVVPVENAVKRAYLLADPEKQLDFTGTEGGQCVQLPARAPDPIASVVVLDVEGEPKLKSITKLSEAGKNL